jgi:hypothetical protein
VVKIVSGGQTGVDRAALDVSVALGLSHGGWCPRGGWAEDMPNPPGLLARYPGVKETPSKNPSKRTGWNVRDSDRTLILVDHRGPAPSQGTALTLRLVQRYGRPHLLVDIDGPDAVERIATWLADAGEGLTLNVAGPRESTAPGIYGKARRVLMEVFQRSL